MKILLLFPKYPSQTIYNLDDSVQVICGRRSTMAPLGLLTVASYLPEDFEPRLIDRNIADESALDWQWADVVFLSAMLIQRDDYEVCLANAARHGKPVAVGGPFTSAYPDKVARDAQWVCYGEAESIMGQFVEDLRLGRRGLQYHGGNTTQMELVKLPRYDLLPNINDYYVMPVQFSRGCPFNCEFCDIIEIYGRVPRTKAPSQITAELDAINALGFDGAVFLVDDNFIGNRARALEVLEAMASWNAAHGCPFTYFTEASLNLADHPDLLDAMARANFIFVFVGIETPDPVLLKAAKKHHNATAEPLERLGTIREHGIHIVASILMGFDGETRSVFDRQLAFTEASGIGVMIPCLMQAVPNTQLSRRMADEGRLLPKQDVAMNITLEGLNFVPKGELTKREYLQSFSRLIEQIYDPEAFFARIKPAHLALRRKVLPGVKLSHLGLLVRLCWVMGFRLPEVRRHFWGTFLTVLRRNPRALASLCFDCVHFYHLYHHRSYARAVIADYLENPPVEDVLDKVLPFGMNGVLAAAVAEMAS